MQKFFEIIDIKSYSGKTVIIVWIDPTVQNTGQKQGFAKRLLENLPRLRYHLCDNKDKNSFAEEVEETELAHAFEHAVLDIIGQKDTKAEVIAGFTKWDWRKMPRHTYEIHIEYEKTEIISESIKEAEELFVNLLQTGSAS